MVLHNRIELTLDILIVNSQIISSRFSSNSEANASELLENLAGMLSRHYMYNDMQNLAYIQIFNYILLYPVGKGLMAASYQTYFLGKAYVISVMDISCIKTYINISR